MKKKIIKKIVILTLAIGLAGFLFGYFQNLSIKIFAVLIIAIVFYYIGINKEDFYIGNEK